MLIAVTDLETTGLDFRIHEIIDVGLLVIDSTSLDIIDRLDVKVKPMHIETASIEAMKINGYNESEWKDAISLREAMMAYSDKASRATFLAHNVTFDWSFIDEAFRTTKVKNQMDYHRIDLHTLAWIFFKYTKLKRFNLNKIAEFLDVPGEPDPHRAINGATTAFEIFKKIMAYEKRMKF